MAQAKEITLKLKLSARYVFFALIMALIIWRPAVLESAQSMTMTSYYPAPYGGYNQLLTTGNTYLGDVAGSKTFIGRNNGSVCVGSGASGYGPCPGSGNNSQFFVMGTSYLGYPKSASDAAVPNTYIYGNSYVGYGANGNAYLSNTKRYVRIGSGSATVPSYGSSAGVYSSVPYSTNAWIYVGTNGYYTNYNTPNQRSGASNSNRMGVLVDSSNASSAGGIGVVNGSYSSMFNVTDNEASFGGAANTPLHLVAGGFSGISMTAANPPVITMQGNVYFQKNIYLKGNTAASASTKIYGLCVQKTYGYGQTNCPEGYAAIGYLPNDGISGGGAIYAGDSGRGYVNVHVHAGGWLTCCAVGL